MKIKTPKLNKYQKETISEQLAEFFYSFWINQKNNLINSDNKIIVSKSGFRENFPDNLKQ
jgi:hypothetical protein